MRHETEWNGRVTSAELRSTEPLGVGSRFALVNGGTAYDATITTYERPSRLVVQAKGKPDVAISYALSPTAGGTELKSELDFLPKGAALKLLFTLLGPVIRRDVPKQYRSLKALCER